MNANSTFFIGHNHVICEDYALSGVENNMAYAIVCDGCSASPDVDFGARLLAMAAKTNLFQGGILGNLSPESFEDITLLRIKKIYEMLPHLHSQALDSTLLVAWVKDKKLTVYLYGDGMLVHRLNDRVRFYHLEITSGAPDYLSYWLDIERKKGYEKIERNYKTLISGIGNISDMCWNIPLFKPYFFTCYVEEGDVISLISDGINSFRKADNTPIPWNDLIEEFTAYKTFEGEFVLRRISAFKRKCLKEGIVHSDDISVSSIYV